MDCRQCGSAGANQYWHIQATLSPPTLLIPPSISISSAEEDNRRRLLRRERLNSIASATLHGININRDLLQSCEEKNKDEKLQQEEFLKEVLWD